MIMLKIALIFLLSYVYCHAGKSGCLKNHLIKEMERNLKDLQSMHVHNGENSGETYIRWGKSSCPEESNLVYDGFAAGKHLKIGGSGSNILCLSKKPEWKDYIDGENTWRGKLYGIEYEFGNNKPYPNTFRDKDMPCAVCLSTRSTVLMVPGKLTCHDGWHKEFSGFLLSQVSIKDRAPSEYICVDEKLESVPGGDSNHNQAVMYPVEAVCGSLKCPPYVNGRELTCVVCSK